MNPMSETPPEVVAEQSGEVEVEARAAPEPVAAAVEPVAEIAKLPTKPKRTKPVKSNPKPRAARSAAPKTKEVKKMAPKKKKAKSDGKKIGTALAPETMRKIRKLQAKIQIETGNRVSISDAVEFAVSKLSK